MASAAVSAASSGQNTVVAAPGAGKFIRVYGYVLVASSSVTAKWQSNTTDLTGAMSFTANSGVASGWARDGWFDCNTNEALKLNLGGALQVSGHVLYEVRG
jgi:hypothetical protein